MPAHTSQKLRRHWSKSVRDVSIVHEGLQLRVEGGAENGEFLYVAALPSEKLRYRTGRFRVGDILIELNEDAVVGLTLNDLMNRINKAGRKLNFKVVQPGGGISKDLKEFLNQEFPNSDEVDLDLQDMTRDNLYARTIPCTTRSPRSGEEPGIDYMFVSREKFLEMDENGDFLETGMYNGHYYGTPKPLLNPQINLSEREERLPETLEDVGSVNTEKGSILTVHRDTEDLNQGTSHAGRGQGESKVDVTEAEQTDLNGNDTLQKNWSLKSIEV